MFTPTKKHSPVKPSFHAPAPPKERHKGEYAKVLNTIEKFYGKGMESHEVECIIALLNECDKDRAKRVAPEPNYTLPTPPPNSRRNDMTINVEAEGLDEIEKQLKRIRGLTIKMPDFTSRKQKYIVSFDGKRGDITLDALRKFGEETIEALRCRELVVIPNGFKLTILNEDGTTRVIG